MSAPFTHMELSTTDVPKAKAFYGELFHWGMEDLPNMPYTLLKAGKGPSGGIMPHPMPGAPSFWLPYVEVEDIKASTKKAVSLGATLIRDVEEVMDAGYLSIFTDPTGATLGLWQNKSK